MPKRQRIMLIVVGALAGVGLVSRAGPWMIEPLTKAKKDLAKYKKEYRKYHDVVEGKSDLQKRYRALAAESLDLNETEAAKAFHVTLNQVAGASKLGRPTINKVFARSFTDKGTKARVTVVKTHVSGQGGLKEVVNFLGRFYELPYLMQIREVSLTPVYGRKGTTMKLEAEVEGLVLQSNPLVGKDPPVPTAPRPPAKVPRSDRLARDNLLAYAPIYGDDIFDPTLAKIEQRTSGDRRPRQPVKPGRKGKDTRGNVLVVGVTRYPWVDANTKAEYLIQEVMTRNERTQEKLLFRVGDKLDAGELVHVDSSGAVVRTGSGSLLFYPLGKSLQDSEPLDPELHAEQYWAVQEEERKAGR